jgi:hypothetical protein
VARANEQKTVPACYSSRAVSRRHLNPGWDYRDPVRRNARRPERALPGCDACTDQVPTHLSLGAGQGQKHIGRVESHEHPVFVRKGSSACFPDSVDHVRIEIRNRAVEFARIELPANPRDPSGEAPGAVADQADLGHSVFLKSPRDLRDVALRGTAVIAREGWVREVEEDSNRWQAAGGDCPLGGECREGTAGCECIARTSECSTMAT